MSKRPPLERFYFAGFKVPSKNTMNKQGSFNYRSTVILNDPGSIKSTIFITTPYKTLTIYQLARSSTGQLLPTAVHQLEVTC